MRSRTSVLVVALLAAPFAGCLAPEGTLRPGTERHVGEEILLSGGGLVVAAGARYELDRSTLRLHDDPGVVLNGVVEVHGALVLRDSIVSGLFRLVAHEGSMLVLENVTVEAGAVAPTLVLLSDDVRIVDSTLHVRMLDVAGAAEISGTRVVGGPAPVVVWRDAPVRLVDSVVEGEGTAVVLQRTSGLVAGNTVRAGAGDTTFGIAVQQGSVDVDGNDVVAGVGIAAEGASGRIRGNVVRGSGLAGVVVVGGSVRVTGNTVEDGGRAGILVRDASIDVEGNAVRRVEGAGVLVEGGAPRVRENDLEANGVGVAVLAGAPLVHRNNLEGNRLAGVAAAENRTVEATENWWGAATGPAPLLPDPAPATPWPAPADRAGPNVRSAPWLTERRT